MSGGIRTYHIISYHMNKETGIYTTCDIIEQWRYPMVKHASYIWWYDEGHDMIWYDVPSSVNPFLRHRHHHHFHGDWLDLLVLIRLPYTSNNLVSLNVISYHIISHSGACQIRRQLRTVERHSSINQSYQIKTIWYDHMIWYDKSKPSLLSVSVRATHLLYSSWGYGLFSA